MRPDQGNAHQEQDDGHIVAQLMSGTRFESRDILGDQAEADFE
jgi:hypothetical protein